MSYRSIKRVLGETRLELKCRLLFGACLLVLITGSFWWYGRQSDRLVFQQNSAKGRALVDLGMYKLHWNELDANKVFAAGMTEGLSQQDYQWEPILTEASSLRKPIPEEFRPRDSQERRFVEELLKADSRKPGDDTPEFRERLSDDGSSYQYYQPIRAQASCYVGCHLPLPEKGEVISPEVARSLGRSVAQVPGDLMAVIRVTIPNRSTQKAMDQNRAILITAAILTVALAMVAAYVIVRYVIVKPLKHLRDVSDAVSHGDISLRADIHTGDEFEDLAAAFNRMLRHLISAQEELRHVNADLDAKVDELAQANMQLYETNRLKSDFLATMSHELRTPLNSILGFSDVLGSIDSLDERQKRYVANIQKSGRTLLEMINNILDLAKLESGRADVRPSEFPIEQVVGAQCDMARPLTEKKNIDLESEVQPNLPPLRQDQARVQQILNNLLSNAIKFTPEGGRITVTARRSDEGELVLRVADTGVGIAEEDLEAIFQKFRQGGNTLADGDAMTREYSGTGLGLSIVKELCKLLGGEVSAESRLGKGSTFTVRLPWTLQEQPRLDSPISDDLDQFTKPRALAR